MSSQFLALLSSTLRNHLKVALVKVFWNICANISLVAPSCTIELVQDRHLKLMGQSHIWEKRERLVIHEIFHLVGPFDHLLHLIYLLINLLLSLEDRGILIGLVFLLATLEVLKLLYNKVHVFPQLNLACHHSV